MRNKFKGTGVALITPFREDKSVDYDSLERLVDYCTAGGVDYLVVNGTTSEASTLELEEKADILDFIIEKNTEKLPIMYGIGANNTSYVLEVIKRTNFAHIDAILTVSPYYNKPSQEGIYQHYKTIADASEVPVLLYNVPGRTGINISADTTIRLSQHDNIFGIKEASGDIEQCLQIIKSKPEDFMLISGDDLGTIPMISIGGEGVISVLANAYPERFSKAIRHALEGDFKSATDGILFFTSLNELLYKESNPVGIKEVLKQKGLCQPWVRLPLIEASEDLQAAIKKYM